MSLINQMLRDLEERRGDGVASPLKSEGAVVTRARGGRLLAGAVALLALALLVLAYVWWQSGEGARPQVAADEKVVPASAPAAKDVAEFSTPRIDAMQPQRPHTSPQLQVIYLSGVGFERGCQVAVDWGEGEQLLTPDRVQFLDAGRLQLSLRTGSEANRWRIQVINPDGGRSAPFRFETLPPMATAPAPSRAIPAAAVVDSESLPSPRIEAMQPERPQALGGSQRLTLLGEGFSEKSRVRVAWGGREKLLPADRITVLDEGRLQLELRMGTRAQAWSLQVINGELASNIHRFETRPAEEAMVDAAEPELRKQRRPFSPAQQAEQAYKEAYELLQQRRNGEAEERLLKALRLSPEHRAARETLAGLMIADGRRSDALNLLEAGLGERPGDPAFAELAARLRLEQGDQAGALALLEQGMAGGANDAEYLALAAAVYQREGRFGESVGAYQRALSLNASNPAWWLGMGISLEGAEQGEQAMEAYRRAAESRALDAKLRRYAQGRIEALRAAKEE